MEASQPAVLPPIDITAVPDTAQRSAAALKKELKPRAQPIPIHPHAAVSPSRLRSQSPMLHSPASSEIFERNVQEPATIATLQSELSPAHIPSHVITEDHIPPALEASAQAITSEYLKPDDVEIVTSTAHQPAAASVLEVSSSHTDLLSLNSPTHSPLPTSPPTLKHHASEDSERVAPPPLSATSSFPTEDDTASNYGQLDPNDVRRLSFISFKDIVQSEHQQQHAQHQAHLAASIDSLPDARGIPGLATPPPGSLNASFAHGHEQSPVRSGAIPLHGELAIETLGQALRKTASGDLSSGRSAMVSGLSPTSEAGPGVGLMGRGRVDS